MTQRAASMTPVAFVVILAGDGTYHVKTIINGTEVGDRQLPAWLGAIAMAAADHVTVRARVFEAERVRQANEDAQARRRVN